MPTNSVRDDREAEWQAGYAMHISSLNKCPMLDLLKTTVVSLLYISAIRCEKGKKNVTLLLLQNESVMLGSDFT